MNGVMTRGAGALALVVLAACQPEDGLPPELRAMTGVEETQCLGAGGQFIYGPWGPQCGMPTEDAGKACTRQSECSTLCLAEEGDARGQCAPLTPIYGCVGMLDETGTWGVLCIE